MAIDLQLAFLTISIIVSFCISRTSVAAQEQPPPSIFPSPPPLGSQEEVQEPISPTAVFEPVLTTLGFHELAMAVPSLSDSAFTTWNGPSTLFAPSDASIRSCASCSVAQLLREHMVPGIFSLDYLRKLAFGTKLETMNHGRCMTVTSADNNTKIFIGGVEITHPDLYNNGLIVIHGLQGYVAPLSPFSCNVERMTSLSFPPQPPGSARVQSLSQYSIMRLMLRDAMLRLRNNGFSVLSLALWVKYAELVNVKNMTVFALDDESIFSGGHAYISNVRFHIVPDRLLMHADLAKLPVGTVLPTLENGQTLVVTNAGAGGAAAVRINYVRIRNPDVMHNLKIVVHSVVWPFPHLHRTAFGGIGGGSVWDATGVTGVDGAFQTRDGKVGTCEAAEEGGCAVAPTQEIKAAVGIEDHHGL